MPNQIALKTTTVNAILAFLGTQPYQSVAGLIQAIQQEANEVLQFSKETIEQQEEISN